MSWDDYGYHKDTHPGEVMSAYEDMKALGASDSLIAGYDILTDDGYPMEEAARMLIAAEGMGKDPEAFARHVRKLRHALRDLS